MASRERLGDTQVRLRIVRAARAIAHAEHDEESPLVVEMRLFGRPAQLLRGGLAVDGDVRRVEANAVPEERALDDPALGQQARLQEILPAAVIDFFPELESRHRISFRTDRMVARLARRRQTTLRAIRGRGSRPDDRVRESPR